jgi:hypothetical protein
MIRRLISLLLAVALLGVTGQSAAYAARGPGSMQSAHVANCMKMTELAAPHKAAKHKDCMPADCLNYMIACAGIAALSPDDATPSFVTYDRRSLQRPGRAIPLRGRSLPPDIQPPIA